MKKNNNLFHNRKFIEVITTNILNCKVYELDKDLYYTIKKKYGIIIIEVIPFSLYDNFSINIENNDLDKYISILEKHQYDIIRININPLHPQKTMILNLFLEHNYTSEEYYASVLELGTSLSETRKKFNKSTKKHTNGCEKNKDITVFETNEKKYFTKYYEIYKDSLERWGVKKEYYSKQLIEDLSKVDNISLWVGILNGKMVSGMIVFYDDDTVFDWLAANYIREDIKKNRVAVAVQYEVIKNAIDKKIKYVNMGASNYNDGVDFFKRRWGADYFNAYRLEKFSFRMKILNFILREVNKISKNGFLNYLKNKIGASYKLINNKYMDYKLINNSNILNKDIDALYEWSKTTQSIDYVYLKYSLKKLHIENNDVVLDLGSGKGRILFFLDAILKKINIDLYGAELNKDAFLISQKLCENKNIKVFNENALENDFINKFNINKIILFNPFDEQTFDVFIKYLLENINYPLVFIYINISVKQIEVLSKYNIRFEIDKLHYPLIGIDNKENMIGYINE